MPLFISNEELSSLSGDSLSVAARVDAYIRDLQSQLDTVHARNDTSSITNEQTYALLEQKNMSLSQEFSKLDYSSLVAARAVAYIRDLQSQLDTIQARNDASSIINEQTSTLLEQKYMSLSEEFSKLESKHAHLQNSVDQCA
ncbi:hypothetical protein QYF36_017509 [Acer negundo]|nr:hypothetical protein QYF36_017509 [Acer negundo]